MLRLRSGVGHVVHSPPAFVALRSPRRCILWGQRLMSTTTSSPDEESKPEAESDTKAIDPTRQAIEEIEANQRELRKKIKEMKKAAKRSKEKVEGQTSDESQEDDFTEALTVARNVYVVAKKKRQALLRVEKAAKEPGEAKKGTKRKEMKRTKTQTRKPDVESGGTGPWSTLREKLEKRLEEVVDPSPLEAGEAALVRSSAKAKKASKRASKKAVTVNIGVQSLTPRHLPFTPIDDDKRPTVPNLSYGLDRALFNPGVYTLQDRRSRVFNFDPYLASIMPVEEFDFNALKEYITSSRDPKLRDLSAERALKYCGSTSSLTSMLSHFHFLLSGWRKPNFENLSRSFDVEYESYTALTKGPAAAFARLQDGVYAIDADKEFDTANILSMLGKSMEKLLTLPKEEFEKYRRDRSHQLSDEEKNADEAYHYTTFGDFMLRSQLDAHDPRLPGTGMFDLKTRAVVSIRMDVTGYEKGLGYEILNRFGTWESFEREYYDMIRSAFLKYSLQVRMGRMDGIFVAFHNTQRIFGFQYVSLEEMDLALHGTKDGRLGDEEFKASLSLLNEALDKATKRFPNKSLRLHVETRETNPPLTYFFAEPVTDEQIKDIQSVGQQSVERFETDILGLTRKDIEAESAELDAEVAKVEREHLQQEEEQPDEVFHQEGNDTTWDDMMTKLDEAVENEARGFAPVEIAIREALDQSGLLKGKTDEQRTAYINALVEALSADIAESKIADCGSEELVENNLDYESEESPGLSVDQGQVSGGFVSLNDAMSGRSTKIADSVSPDVESIEISKGDEVCDEVSETTQENVSEESTEIEEQDSMSSPQGSTLKDLILKVAEKADNKMRSLKTFERVLSELAAQAKESEVDDATETTLEGDSTQQLAENEVAAAIQSNDTSETGSKSGGELLGMYITVRNKVNGKAVHQPSIGKNGEFKWDIEYTFTELPDERAQRIYGQIKKRRKLVLQQDPEEKASRWFKMWQGQMAKKTAEGKRWRKNITKLEAGQSIYGAWDRSPIAHNPGIPEELESEDVEESAVAEEELAIDEHPEGLASTPEASEEAVAPVTDESSINDVIKEETEGEFEESSSQEPKDDISGQESQDQKKG